MTEMRADGTPRSRFELVNRLHEAAKLVDWDAPERVCRGCGCTDERACIRGCWWVDVDDARGPLCSSCDGIVRRLGEPAWDPE